MMIIYSNFFTNAQIYKSRITRVIIAGILCLYVLFSPSCANPGVGPVGGLKDTIPPLVIYTLPLNGTINYSEKQIEVAFNEYITLDNISNKLVVSPPLAQKPTIKTKGKDVLIKFNEDLIPLRTYSIDFQNSIKDFNEGNTLDNQRLIFSTYEFLDTLQIKGYMLDAFNLEPIENALATLYTFDNDTVFQTIRPDFIARTNKQGYFLFDNLPKGDYWIYGIVDSDNNYKFSNQNEQIAFIDSAVSPSVQFIEKIDTLINQDDTVIVTGYNKYLPNDIYVRMFFEKKYNQVISSFKRPSKQKFEFVFAEELMDSAKFEIVNNEVPYAWNYMEYSKGKDSIAVWITDSLVWKIDSLLLKVSYLNIDTIGSITKTDTLKMYNAIKPNLEVNEFKSFNLLSNATTSLLDINKTLYIETPSPILSIDTSKVHLVEIIDSTENVVPFKLEFAEHSQRKVHINFDIKENTSYKLTVDSATVMDQYHSVNNTFSSKFKSQKNDYYGTFEIDISGIKTPKIIQLLKNSKNEEIEYELFAKNDQTSIKFTFLKPSKYKVKVIADKNKNKKWDNGSLTKRELPEMVYYFSKIIEVKSNWDLKENWTIDETTPLVKEISKNIEK